MTRGLAVTAAALLVASCKPGEVLEWSAPPASAREAYVRALEDAGLHGTALVRDWVAMGEIALGQPAFVPAAFRETAMVGPDGAAHAWRLMVRRGQRVRVSIRTDSITRVFVDAFELRGGERDPTSLGWSQPGDTVFDVEPVTDGDVVIRAQPELLRHGHFQITLRTEPTFVFPVSGRGMPDVGSVYGDPRDAGARRHHGIDIFAPRGTPVIAATDGTVSRVSVTAVGGRVVWLRDGRRSQSLYYAHLDSQLVSRGMRVEIGDTLGLVGNTGNARTTPPHLHFGVYSRGPVDPSPFVRPVAGSPPAPPRNAALVGAWVRTNAAETALLEAPASSAGVTSRLPRSTAMQVLGMNAEWARVRLPDGGSGYVDADRVEPADAALASSVTSGEASLRAGPAAASEIIATLRAGEAVSVQGRFGDFLLVRTDRGQTGWIQD